MQVFYGVHFKALKKIKNCLIYKATWRWCHFEFNHSFKSVCQLLLESIKGQICPHAWQLKLTLLNLKNKNQLYRPSLTPVLSIIFSIFIWCQRYICMDIHRGQLELWNTYCIYNVLSYLILALIIFVFSDPRTETAVFPWWRKTFPTSWCQSAKRIYYKFIQSCVDVVLDLCLICWDFIPAPSTGPSGTSWANG